MKKLLAALLCIGLVLSLTACGSDSQEATPKSSELAQEYDFYENSVYMITKNMNITPEQADEVFIILVQCGLNDKITNIFSSGDSSYAVWFELNRLDVKLKDGVVESVKESTKTLYPKQESESYEQTTKPATLEAKIDDAIKNASGVKEDVKVLDNVNGGKNIEIALKGKDNLTANMVRTGMLIQANDILEELQPLDEIAQVCLFWTFPLVDAYGNTRTDTVMKILIKKETLNKINFENFDWNKLPTIADEYHESAALTAK